jgi:hypothetical protein
VRHRHHDGGFAVVRSWRLIAAAAAALVLQAACAPAGDFGRPRYPALLPSASAVETGAALSAFPLTDDERELRQLADNLLAPPGPPVSWLSYVPPASARAPLEANAYTTALLGEGQSSAARYARLVDDIRNDAVRMDPFFAVAWRVADLDQKRERSLAYVSGLSPGEAAHARNRVAENKALVRAVHRTLRARARVYRFTLERLVIAQPSPLAVEAERAWSDLDRRQAMLRVDPAGR